MVLERREDAGKMGKSHTTQGLKYPPMSNDPLGGLYEASDLVRATFYNPNHAYSKGLARDWLLGDNLGIVCLM